MESKSTSEGLKKACNYYMQAAGVFQYICDSLTSNFDVPRQLMSAQFPSISCWNGHLPRLKNVSSSRESLRNQLKMECCLNCPWPLGKCTKLQGNWEKNLESDQFSGKCFPLTFWEGQLITKPWHKWKNQLKLWILIITEKKLPGWMKPQICWIVARNSKSWWIRIL